MFARIRTMLVLAVAFVAMCLFASPATAAPSYTQVLRNGTDAAVVTATSHAVDSWMVSIGKRPAKWSVVPYGATSKGDACTKERVPSSEVMWYCSLDNTIYVGLDMIREFRTHAGWLSPLIAMFHENGHHLSYLAGSDAMFEDQADCVSGAGLEYANSSYGLGVSLMDVPGLLRLVGAISRPYDVSRAEDEHGTQLERGSAITGGFMFGVSSCNNWDRSHPLV